MSQHTDQSIAFKYIFTYDYNPVYVNGAHGGVSPRGELVANFYLERQPLPNEITHTVGSDGAIGDVAAVDPKDLNSSMVRYVASGIVLNYENARNLHQWLGDKISEMEQMARLRSEMVEKTQQG
jgi:hypothetical protein